MKVTHTLASHEALDFFSVGRWPSTEAQKGLPNHRGTAGLMDWDEGSPSESPAESPSRVALQGSGGRGGRGALAGTGMSRGSSCLFLSTALELIDQKSVRDQYCFPINSNLFCLMLKSIFQWGRQLRRQKKPVQSITQLVKGRERPHPRSPTPARRRPRTPLSVRNPWRNR